MKSWSRSIRTQHRPLHYATRRPTGWKEPGRTLGTRLVARSQWDVPKIKERGSNRAVGATPPEPFEGVGINAPRYRIFIYRWKARRFPTGRLYVKEGKEPRLALAMRRRWLRACKEGRQDRPISYERENVHHLMKELGSARLRDEQDIVDLCEHALAIKSHSDIRAMYGPARSCKDVIVDVINAIRGRDVGIICGD